MLRFQWERSKWPLVAVGGGGSALAWVFRGSRRVSRKINRVVNFMWGIGMLGSGWGGRFGGDGGF